MQINVVGATSGILWVYINLPVFEWVLVGLWELSTSRPPYTFHACSNFMTGQGPITLESLK